MTSTLDTTVPNLSRSGWNCFRYVVAGLLAAAAVVKIVNMPQILSGGGLLATIPRLAAVTAFEAAVATYLLVGNRFWSWLLTLVTFSAFVASTVYAMATNQSCDCFGEQINPETMVGIDTVVLLLTASLRPGRQQSLSRSLIRQLFTVAVAGGLVAGVAVWRYEVLAKNERSRLLIVDLLLEKPWPLTEQMHPKLSELSSGTWMILISQRDCVHCQELVNEYFGDPTAHRSGERTAVFVFGGDDDRWRFQFDRITLDLSDETAFDWTIGHPYVVNPAIFLVENGIVIDGAEGTAADSFMKSLWSDHEQTHGQ